MWWSLDGCDARPAGFAAARRLGSGFDVENCFARGSRSGISVLLVSAAGSRFLVVEKGVSRPGIRGVLLVVRCGM